MRLEIHTRRNFLEAVIAGRFSLKEAKRTFLEILEAVSKIGAENVLVDGRKLTGRPDTIERFFYGQFAARAVREYVHQQRGLPPYFAYLLSEPVLDPRRLGETVASNRGMLVKAFDDPEKALAWLGTRGR